ncbi:MAG: hypothetical protein RLZZ124_610 [Cyanobacteriota bacterium]|jgi:hypothetical protein
MHPLIAGVAPEFAGVALDPVQLVSLVGAVMQLLAYALMQLGRLPSESYPYQLANVIGSLLMTVVATLNHEYGFILMEAVWFLTSAYGLIRLMRSQAGPLPSS